MPQNNEDVKNEEILILAVVGMPATGKSEVIKKLKEQFNFFHLYYGGITLDEVKRRGLEINEVNEKFVREDMRKSGDLGIFSKFMLLKIEEAIKNGEKRILLESMYNIYEYEYIKNVYGNNFKVLAIHTDADIRIKRINERKDRKLTEEELVSRQISEAKNLQKGTVISFADFHYTNNGSDMETFEKDLEDIIKNKIFKK
jgi:dephospho-CoA kinase